MKYLFTTFLILFLCSSCKKAESIPDDYSFMVGKYKWSYSADYFPTEEEADYSLIIEKSGKIYSYKDGKKHYKLKISSYRNCDNCVEKEAVFFETYDKKRTSISGFVVVLEDGLREMKIDGLPFGLGHKNNYYYSYE